MQHHTNIWYFNMTLYRKSVILWESPFFLWPIYSIDPYLHVSRDANENYPGSCSDSRAPMTMTTNLTKARACTSTNTRSLPSTSSVLLLSLPLSLSLYFSFFLLELPLAANPATRKVKDLIREPVSIDKKSMYYRDACICVRVCITW